LRSGIFWHKFEGRQHLYGILFLNLTVLRRLGQCITLSAMVLPWKSVDLNKSDASLYCCGKWRTIDLVIKMFQKYGLQESFSKNPMKGCVYIPFDLLRGFDITFERIIKLP
jgi:hypothetical protein